MLEAYILKMPDIYLDKCLNFLESAWKPHTFWNLKRWMENISSVLNLPNVSTYLECEKLTTNLMVKIFYRFIKICIYWKRRTALFIKHVQRHMMMRFFSMNLLSFSRMQFTWIFHLMESPKTLDACLFKDQ